jgi:hypothetical protein
MYKAHPFPRTYRIAGQLKWEIHFPPTWTGHGSQEFEIQPIRVNLRWKGNSERKGKRRTEKSISGTLLEYNERRSFYRTLVLQLERLGNSVPYI